MGVPADGGCAPAPWPPAARQRG